MSASVPVTQSKVSRFLSDVMSSLVVFLVAVPLCLGIALACGLPPALGLVSGIIGGIVVGTLSGCPLQVSGPAAGLIAIVAGAYNEHGLAGLALAVILSGLLQIIFGSLKLAKWFRAVSPAVIQGMLAGIGILILASQFHVMIDDSPSSNAIENIIKIPHAIFKAVSPIEGKSHHLAALVGVLTMSVLILWNFMPRKIKLIPAPLVAIIVGVSVAMIGDFPIQFVQIPDQFWNVLHFPTAQDLPKLFTPGILITGLTIAFVASAETLLSASAVDMMHGGLKTKYDKEIIAQGVGNTLAGFVGVLPITGVIVRSAANAQAGGKTRMATILHGVWILAAVIFFPHVLEIIPTASLAAILVYTGYKLVQPNTIKKLMVVGRTEVGIYLLTIITILSTSLLEGVIVGIVASALKLLYIHSDFQVNVACQDNSNRYTMHLKGNASFVNLPNFSISLEKIPPQAELHVYIDQLNYIDHACLELLLNWEKQHAATGGHVILEWETLANKTTKPSNPSPVQNPQELLNAIRSGSH